MFNTVQVFSCNSHLLYTFNFYSVVRNSFVLCVLLICECTVEFFYKKIFFQCYGKTKIIGNWLS